MIVQKLLSVQCSTVVEFFTFNTKMPDIRVKGLTNRLNYSILLVLANRFKNPIKVAFFYYLCVFLMDFQLECVHLAQISLLLRFPIDQLPHLRIHFLCIFVPSDQLFVISVTINPLKESHLSSML